MKRRYHPATRAAFRRHIVEQRGFPHTYLLMHPRVTQAEVNAICEDLYRELFDRAGRSEGAANDG